MYSLDEVLQEYIIMIFSQVSAIEPVKVKNMVDAFESDFKNYQAIGIIDGNPKYYQVMERKEAYLKRAKALYNLLEVLHETNPVLNPKA
jgi:hypothetical protein